MRTQSEFIPPDAWLQGERRIEQHGTRDGLIVWLWPEHAVDVVRIERAYWQSRKRAERTYERFSTASQAILDAGGIAYSTCRGNCAQPCFYRWVVKQRPEGLTSWLDCHATPLAEGGLGSLYDKAPPEREPTHLELGEAYWAAMEAMKTANGKWLAWKAVLLRLLASRLQKPAREGTAHVVVNGRDYWFGTESKGSGLYWRSLLTPEDDRVEVVLG